jgi:hypothetical protein
VETSLLQGKVSKLIFYLTFAIALWNSVPLLIGAEAEMPRTAQTIEQKATVLTFRSRPE